MNCTWESWRLKVCGHRVKQLQRGNKNRTKEFMVNLLQRTTTLGTNMFLFFNHQTKKRLNWLLCAPTAEFCRWTRIGFQHDGLIWFTRKHDQNIPEWCLFRPWIYTPLSSCRWLVRRVQIAIEGTGDQMFGVVPRHSTASKKPLVGPYFCGNDVNFRAGSLCGDFPLLWAAEQAKVQEGSGNLLIWRYWKL